MSYSCDRCDYESDEESDFVYLSGYVCKDCARKSNEYPILKCPECGVPFKKISETEYEVNCHHLWGIGQKEIRLVRRAEQDAKEK